MALRFAELMFTPAVKAEQERLGSRTAYARAERPEAPARDRFGPAEAAFIAARDSFYVASVSETGWPYIQHRGGPPGFLKLLDDRTLGFADFRGNRQYVSLGNLKSDDRVALFLMDYPHRRRRRCWATRARTTPRASPTWWRSSPTPATPPSSSVASLSRSRASTGTARSTSPRASPKPRSRPRWRPCASACAPPRRSATRSPPDSRRLGSRPPASDRADFQTRGA